MDNATNKTYGMITRSTILNKNLFTDEYLTFK